MIQIYAVHCHKYVYYSDYAEDYEYVVRLFSSKESAIKYIENEIHICTIYEHENVIDDRFNVTKKVLRAIKTYDEDEEATVHREFYYTEHDVYD